jgi:hypothetical protein
MGDDPRDSDGQRRQRADGRYPGKRTASDARGWAAPNGLCVSTVVSPSRLCRAALVRGAGRFLPTDASRSCGLVLELVLGPEGEEVVVHRQIKRTTAEKPPTTSARR